MRPNGHPTRCRSGFSSVKGWCPSQTQTMGRDKCRILPYLPVATSWTRVAGQQEILTCERWTRPMRRDLIVKLLFIVAEPAHFLFFDNSLYFRDLLCYFLQSNSCTLSYCCNSLGHQAERNGLFQHYPLYYLDLACTFASWLTQVRRAWSGTLLTGVLLLVTLRRFELTISSLRGQLPVHLEDRAI